MVLFHQVIRNYNKNSRTSIERICGGLRELEARDVVELQSLQHLFSLGVNFDDIVFQSGHFRNVVVPSLPLFFLELDGDPPDLGVAQTLHEMSHESGDLIPQGLGRNDGDLLADPLVCVKVHRQSGVVLLDDYFRGFFHRLGTYTTHLDLENMNNITLNYVPFYIQITS